MKRPALLVGKEGPKGCGSPPPCRQVSCRRAHSDGAASVGSNDRNVNAEVLRGFHSGLSTDAVDEVAAEATRYVRAGQRFSGRAHPARVRLGAAAPLREGREPFSSEVPALRCSPSGFLRYHSEQLGVEQTYPPSRHSAVWARGQTDPPPRSAVRRSEAAAREAGAGPSYPPGAW